MAVVGRDEIEARSSEDGEIIAENFEESCLQPAAYELRVANTEAKVGDRIVTRGDELDNPFALPEREISVVSTKERLRMPEGLSARVGIRLEYAKQGLIPLFGPQVDPGYEGRFYGVVYNASGHPVRVTDGEAFFKMEVHEVRDGRTHGDGRVEHITDISLTDVDHGVTDLSDVTDDLDGRLTAIEDGLAAVREDATKNRERVQGVEKGYTQIALFGVFLIATTVFGVAFQTVVDSVGFGGVEFGPNLETSLLIALLVGWIGMTFVFLWQSLRATGPGDDGRRGDGPGGPGADGRGEPGPDGRPVEFVDRSTVEVHGATPVEAVNDALGCGLPTGPGAVAALVHREVGTPVEEGASASVADATVRVESVADGLVRRVRVERPATRDLRLTDRETAVAGAGVEVDAVVDLLDVGLQSPPGVETVEDLLEHLGTGRPGDGAAYEWDGLRVAAETDDRGEVVSATFSRNGADRRDDDQDSQGEARDPQPDDGPDGEPGEPPGGGGR